jgi:hypothetical protein
VVKQQPQHVAVIHFTELLPGLMGQPVKLGMEEVAELVAAARREETWAE